MDFVPGSKYEETKARLKEGIRDGTFSPLEAAITDHLCFFTRKPTPDKSLMFEFDGGIGIDRFYLCEGCYYSCLPESQKPSNYDSVRFCLN